MFIQALLSMTHVLWYKLSEMSSFQERNADISRIGLQVRYIKLMLRMSVYHARKSSCWSKATKQDMFHSPSSVNRLAYRSYTLEAPGPISMNGQTKTMFSACATAPSESYWTSTIKLLLQGQEINRVLANLYGHNEITEGHTLPQLSNKPLVRLMS